MIFHHYEGFFNWLMEGVGAFWKIIRIYIVIWGGILTIAISVTCADYVCRYIRYYLYKFKGRARRKRN